MVCQSMMSSFFGRLHRRGESQRPGRLLEPHGGPGKGQHRRPVPEHRLQHPEGGQGTAHAHTGGHLRRPQGQPGRAGLLQGVLSNQGNHILNFQ